MLSPRGALTLALLAGLTAGCAGSQASTLASTSPPPGPATEANPSPATSSTSVPAQIPVGRLQVQEHATTALAITVLQFRQPFPAVVSGLPDRKGLEYAAIEVKLCVKKNTGPQVNVSWAP
ncbi:MAG: hypothetical protein JWQ95_268, partial [Sphaerisporangium sp.]|nr:hypothetical protein [Sphaerisporangium sp.]